MTNYTLELIRNLETSWENNNYNWVKFVLINNTEYNTTIDGITYINRYFFKITTMGGSSIFININNLSCVELI